MREFDVRDWYWIVDGQVWSTRRVAYVPADDAAYQAWCVGAAARSVESEMELSAIINRSFPAGSPIRTYTPAEIVNALIAIDTAKAALVAANGSDVDWLRFTTATAILEDDPDLLAALDAVGITQAQLRAAVEA